MPISTCYFFKNSYEFFPATALNKIPVRVRGIYVLYHSKGTHQMDVVYLGRARREKSGAKGRLKSH